MKDLTEKPILGHLLQMAVPIAAGMLFQTMYFLIDLYFVAHLGAAAIAGVGAAGNVTFLVLAVTQVLSVGSVALISHAAGRKDRDDAMQVFNQSLGLAVACALGTLALGYAGAQSYMQTLGADAATRQAGVDYLHWYLPSLALQYALAVMGSALRGTGIVQPTIIVQVLSVMLNAVLAPVLIAGWLTGHPLGVAGAGLASSIAVAVGTLLLGDLFSPPREIRRLRCVGVAAASRGLVAAAAHRAAGRRRVRADVHVHGADVRPHPPLRSRRTGGLRRGHARDAEPVPAVDGGGLRRRAHHRPKFRGRPLRARA